MTAGMNRAAPLSKSSSWIKPCMPGRGVPKIDGPKITWSMSPLNPSNGDVVTFTGTADVGNWNNGSSGQYISWGSEFRYNNSPNDEPYGDDGLCGHGDKWYLPYETGTMDTSAWACPQKGNFSFVTHLNLAKLNRTFPPRTQKFWLRNHWRSEANHGSDYMACFEAQVQFILW